MNSHKTSQFKRIDVPPLENGEFHTILIDLWASLDTAVSLSLAIMLRSGMIDDIIRKKINPSDYITDSSFHLDYQAVKFIAKYEGVGVEVEKIKAAIDAFIWAEDECRLTNRRLINLFDGQEYSPTPSSVVLDIFRDLPKEMDLILKDCPRIEDLVCDFGPGASFATRKDTSAHAKMRSRLEGTFANNSDMMNLILTSCPGWTSYGPTVVTPGCELSFVPKDGKTHRPIGIEPLLNGFVQKGIGRCIRDKLLDQNIDIRKGEGRNGELARKANQLSLATVDLKSASDTISYMLVLHMLTEPWFELLSGVRSPSYMVRNADHDGVWRVYEKFSSMGNGYTFELETAIFLSIAKATCKYLKLPTENISVYGDDIIIPRSAYNTFRDVCQFCGFTINEEKTFVNGSFFESCGKDWFNGTDVRPIFLKKEIKTLRDRFRLINGLLAILDKVTKNAGNCNTDIRRRLNLCVLISECVGNIPLHLRFGVPKHFGDIGIHSPITSAKFTPHGCWDGYSFYGLGSRITKTRLDWEMSDALYKASCLPSEADVFGIVTKNCVYDEKLHKRRLLVTEQKVAFYGDSKEIPSDADNVEIVIKGGKIVRKVTTTELTGPKGYGYSHRQSPKKDVVVKYYVSLAELAGIELNIGNSDKRVPPGTRRSG